MKKHRLYSGYCAVAALLFFFAGNEVDAQTYMQIGGDINGTTANDRAGISVGLSGDGTMAAVGTIGNAGNKAGAGYVNTYWWNGSSWMQNGNIEGENANDQSGYSLSLINIGGSSTMAIGAPGNDKSGTDAGYVRVYDYDWNGMVWQQRGLSINGEHAGEHAGYSLSLSSDGTTVAIGAINNNNVGIDAGSVRIFSWSGNSNGWLQKGTPINGKAAGDYSGASVSISGDGKVVAIGSPLNDDAGTDAGHVRMHAWNGSAWVQKGANIDGAGAGDHFGTTVSLSTDGNIVAVGGPLNDHNGTDAGHMRIYAWDGSAWVQKGSDINGKAAGDHFGWSVSISADGSSVSSGAPMNNDSGTAAGHVSVYTWDGNAWTPKGSSIGGKNAGDFSGTSVSLNSDGNVLAVGAPLNNDSGMRAGSVRLYSMLSATRLSNTAYTNEVNIYPNPAKEELNISGVQDASISIFDAAGRVLIKQQKVSNKINISRLAPGAYFIKIISEGITQVKNFVCLQ